jgi:23S rRNA (uracil-5-)-methyltransferase RumA
MDEKHSDRRRKESFLRLLEDDSRQAPACPHVAEGCGGCMLQEYGYDDQVRVKVRYLEGVYGRPVEVHPCSEPLGYRNRMDFVQAFGKSGLRKRGKYAQVVNVKVCLLHSAAAQEAYRKAREIIISHNIPDYNYIRHDGFLKYIVVRTGEVGEIMVILTTVAPSVEQDAVFRSILHEVAATGATSVWWTTVKGKADVSVGEPYMHVGRDYIIDVIAGKRFRVGPTTFFQANTRMAGELFTAAAEHVRGAVLDLYCGVGVISAIVASKASRVVGVELNAQAVAAAQENASLNKIVNAEFHVADAAQWLASNNISFDTVICDPARPGLGKEACALLLRQAPQRIIYISCNPLTHQEDIERLSAGYEVTLLEGYDLFPQTPHIEVLSVMERKASG